MSITVAKFGGTSLCDAQQFRKVRDIVLSDPSRRFIVASAPGKRFDTDEKITDLLLKCHAAAAVGDSFEAPFRQIRERFDEIIEALGVSFPLDREMETLCQRLKQDPQADYAASRGEYLCARILAGYLGFTFVDPEWCDASTRAASWICP